MGEKSQGAWGIGGGAGYLYEVNAIWGLMTGAEIMTFKGAVEVPHHTFVDTKYSMSGINFNSYYTNYKADIRATYLHIPLMVQYKDFIGGNYIFYAAAGTKIGFALSGSVKETADSAVYTASLPPYGIEMNQLPPRYLPPNDANYAPPVKKVNFGVNASLSLEAGMCWRFKGRMNLYSGLFLDYGLTDLAHQEIRQSMAINTVRLLSTGLKLKLEFGI
ncbi:hypothetical protein FACS1894199_07650 [Bacteroidia bacterium]|nr:hypothetical protein FACS1894199_07650 [Bacteroidia bacterium]